MGRFWVGCADDDDDDDDGFWGGFWVESILLDSIKDSNQWLEAKNRINGSILGSDLLIMMDSGEDSGSNLTIMVKIIDFPMCFQDFQSKWSILLCVFDTSISETLFFTYKWKDPGTAAALRREPLWLLLCPIFWPPVEPFSSESLLGIFFFFWGGHYGFGQYLSMLLQLLGRCILKMTRHQ